LAIRALINCLPGALKLDMIGCLDMARRDRFLLSLEESRRHQPHARENLMGVVADIGFGALEPGGAGLILGVGPAICRAPRLCCIIGQTMPEPPVPRQVRNRTEDSTRGNVTDTGEARLDGPPQAS
jgi:hypothetical protein